MITGFEEITKDLTDYEYQKVVPMVYAGLKNKVGKEQAVSNSYMVDKLKEKGVTTSTRRIRKIIHFLRITGKIKGLIGSSKGYYITYNQEELQEYCKSLEERANSILSIKEILEKQL